ncbi:MAG: hypothetical protein H0W14_00020 [Actinobacteria bacterium]|nr:hypothetical protein [Actinomycetota bacterium]
MPSTPKVGDVFRPENILGVVFEEVRVKEVGKTVQGPRGLIAGAIVADEIHLDGSHSDKVFTPGRGELSTGSDGDTEVLAVAVPADTLTASEPSQLQTISAAALGIVGAVQGRDWEAAAAITKRIGSVTSSLPRDGQPTLVIARLDDAVAALTRAVRARDVARAGTFAIAAGQSTLDLRLATCDSSTGR